MTACKTTSMKLELLLWCSMHKRIRSLTPGISNKIVLLHAKKGRRLFSVYNGARILFTEDEGDQPWYILLNKKCSRF